MQGRKRIYVETSGVNYLFDNIFNNGDFGTIETKKLQIRKGRKWQISNITLWEIFLTKDENRRYALFDFSRCFFYDHLISSPEEIIVNYIKNGCPINETQYELTSCSIFSKEWYNACKNLDYAFQPDREQINAYAKHFRFIGEYFVKKSKGYSLKTSNYFDEESERITCAFLEYIYNQLIKNYGEKIDEDAKYFIIVSMNITMIILCYGIGYDQATIENFWNIYRKNEPLERLDFAVNNFPAIFFRGPISNISRMIILQSKNKTGRGLYFDFLHSIYITYSDMFVTNDDHFFRFKNDNMNDPNTHKIIDVKALNFFKP